MSQAPSSKQNSQVASFLQQYQDGQRDFSGLMLAKANLLKADLSLVVLDEAQFERSNLEGCVLIGSSLNHANLSRSNLSRANLIGADLIRANLEGANLAHAMLSGANLSAVNLRHANLTGASLAGADLSTADLTGAIVDGVNFQGANLFNTNLKDTSLEKVNLDNVDLEEALLPKEILERLYPHKVQEYKVYADSAPSLERQEKAQTPPKAAPVPAAANPFLIMPPSDPIEDDSHESFGESEVAALSLADFVEPDSTESEADPPFPPEEEAIAEVLGTFVEDDDKPMISVAFGDLSLDDEDGDPTPPPKIHSPQGKAIATSQEDLKQGSDLTLDEDDLRVFEDDEPWNTGSLLAAEDDSPVLDLGNGEEDFGVIALEGPMENLEEEGEDDLEIFEDDELWNTGSLLATDDEAANDDLDGAFATGIKEEAYSVPDNSSPAIAQEKNSSAQRSEREAAPELDPMDGDLITNNFSEGVSATGDRPGTTGDGVSTATPGPEKKDPGELQPSEAQGKQENPNNPPPPEAIAAKGAPPAPQANPFYYGDESPSNPSLADQAVAAARKDRIQEQTQDPAHPQTKTKSSGEPGRTIDKFNSPIIHSLQTVLKRRVQFTFQKTLLEAYNHQCAISACDVKALLEAVIINADTDALADHPANGLILRQDLAVLFKLHLLAIAPETYEILLAPSLHTGNYAPFHGQTLHLPASSSKYPNNEFLRHHLKKCKWHDDPALTPNPVPQLIPNADGPPSTVTPTTAIANTLPSTFSLPQWSAYVRQEEARPRWQFWGLGAIASMSVVTLGIMGIGRGLNSADTPRTVTVDQDGAIPVDVIVEEFNYGDQGLVLGDRTYVDESLLANLGITEPLDTNTNPPQLTITATPKKIESDRIGLNINGNIPENGGVIVGRDSYVPVGVATDLGLSSGDIKPSARLTFQGETYVQTAELRRLGVTITWDGQQRMLSLIPPAP